MRTSYYGKFHRPYMKSKEKSKKISDGDPEKRDLQGAKKLPTTTRCKKLRKVEAASPASGDEEELGKAHAASRIPLQNQGEKPVKQAISETQGVKRGPDQIGVHQKKNSRQRSAGQ